jgi:hypothetical protein
MTDEKLTPERAVRLLRAKGGELENWVLHNANNATPAATSIWRLTADIALIAQLLADHIEENQTVRITGPEASGTKYAPPPGWLRDPHDTSASPGERWWDGTDFTHLTRRSA